MIYINGGDDERTNTSALLRIQAHTNHLKALWFALYRDKVARFSLKKSPKGLFMIYINGGDDEKTNTSALLRIQAHTNRLKALWFALYRDKVARFSLKKSPEGLFMIYINGGDDEDRTRDLLRDRQAL